jgi:hypothetical protein
MSASDAIEIWIASELATIAIISGTVSARWRRRSSSPPGVRRGTTASQM